MHEDICESEVKMASKLQELVMNFIHTIRYSNFILSLLSLKERISGIFQSATVYANIILDLYSFHRRHKQKMPYYKNGCLWVIF